MNYKKPEWAIQQVTRASGLVEDICEHGVGHPNEESLRDMEAQGRDGFGIHGCDGCCGKSKRLTPRDKETA